ncbi:tetratricopeptide repeat protein, partial [Candidatus Sumerlaeota bacterium]|nr:tetratricopeptide repeat protein [Candidatus Sumerlaeota bacterium]
MPKVHSAREKISRQQPMLAIGAILSLLLAMAALSVKDIYAAQDAASQRMSFSRRAARALELHGLRELAEPASRSTLLEDQAASRSLQVRIQAARACYLLLQKQSRRARELLEEAAKLAPDVYEIRFLMAEVDSREDDARALRACNQLIKQYPKRIEAYELKGRILEANGKAKEAMAVYSEALKRWPAVNQMIDRLVRLAFAQGDLDVVIDISKRRLKREPRRFEALFMLAYVEELKARAGKDMRLYSDSASHYETALEVQPRQTKLYQRLSEVYTRLDRREKAVATLRRGLVVDPTDRDLQKAFEQAVSPKGNADDVLAAYQSLAEEYSNSADILDLYAAKLMAAQKFGDARKQLENVLKLRPDSAKTLLDLGGLALRDGDNDKARKHFERAADLASQNPEIFERIGSQYAQAGHSDQAVQFLERARAADPGRLTVYYALAQAYQEMGKMDKAVESLQSGLAAVKQPRSRKALLLALAVFQQIDEKYGQALATLRKAYELDRNDIQTFFA